jgi:hypothetical protein
LTLAGALGFDAGNVVHQLDEIDHTFIYIDGFAGWQFERNNRVPEGYVAISRGLTQLDLIRISKRHRSRVNAASGRCPRSQSKRAGLGVLSSRELRVMEGWPVGRSSEADGEGVPIGLQVAARPYCDEIVMGIAGLLGKEFGYQASPMAR